MSFTWFSFCSEWLSSLPCLQCQIKAVHYHTLILTVMLYLFVSCRSQGKRFCLPNSTLRLKNMNSLKGRLTPVLSVIGLMCGSSLSDVSLITGMFRSIWAHSRRILKHTSSSGSCSSVRVRRTKLWDVTRFGFLHLLWHGYLRHSL